MGNMELLRKNAALTTKCPDPESEGREGRISLVVATLDVIDKDLDVIRSGAIGRQEVVIAPFQHGLERGELPIGRGVVYEEDGLVKFDGQLNMELEAARNTWAAIEPVQDLLEVSFGFHTTDESWTDVNGQRIRNHNKIDAREVCIVIVGAGIGTGITDMKAHNPAPELPGPDAAIYIDGIRYPINQLPTADHIQAVQQLTRIAQQR